MNDIVASLRHWNPVTFPLVAQAADEIERLRELLHRTEDEKMELRSQLAEAERDAARYRRLLEGPYPFCFEGIMCHSAADVSKAIDAALDRKP